MGVTVEAPDVACSMLTGRASSHQLGISQSTLRESKLDDFCKSPGGFISYYNPAFCLRVCYAPRCFVSQVPNFQDFIYDHRKET